MANSLLTINMITREAVRLFKNTNAFLGNIDRQYDDQFAITGAKIGDTLRIRLPNDYTVRTGAAASVQDTSEQSVTLTMATQKGVDVSFSTAERTLKLDDFSERVLQPQMNNLAGAIALDVMSGAEGNVCNFVSNTDGSGSIIAPTARTVLNAQANLSTNSADIGNLKLVDHPFTDAAVVQALAGLFNPVQEIGRQYKTGMMREALGFLWFQDQTVIAHTAGTFTAGTVNGAGQVGTTLTTNAITGTLKKGDIITIAGVYQVNRVTKQSTGALRQFVVTADVANGGTSIGIYPAIIPAVGGQAVQYQTVDASPADGAALTLATKANEVYRKNIAFAPQAVTMVSADLYMPTKGVIESAREVYDNMSMRMLTAYIPGTDQVLTRLDVLYGYVWPRPEWACIVADAI